MGAPQCGLSRPAMGRVLPKSYRVRASSLKGGWDNGWRIEDDDAAKPWAPAVLALKRRCLGRKTLDTTYNGPSVASQTDWTKAGMNMGAGNAYDRMTSRLAGQAGASFGDILGNGGLSGQQQLAGMGILGAMGQDRRGGAWRATRCPICVRVDAGENLTWPEPSARRCKTPRMASTRNSPGLVVAVPALTRRSWATASGIL